MFKSIDERKIEQNVMKNLYPFLKGFSEGELEEFKRNITQKSIKKGTAIHEGDTDCIGVVGVIEGRLRTFMLSEEGREVTLFRLLPGDTCLLSASCMLRNISFDVHVNAEEDSKIAVINAKYFETLSAQKSEVEAFKNAIISMRFTEVMWLMEQVLFMKMDKRIANLLIELSNVQGNEEVLVEGISCPTVIRTHQEMADDLGSAREVVSRILKYFENEGIIQMSRRQIVITDSEKLEKMSQ